MNGERDTVASGTVCAGGLGGSRGKARAPARVAPLAFLAEQAGGEVAGDDKQIDQFVQELRTQKAPAARIDDITITSLKSKGYQRFNIRKSNTESVIRLNAEAYKKNDLNKIKKEVVQLIKRS